MTQPSLNESMEVLRDLGAAMRVAEKEDAKSRHGSTLAEYEAARRLGEGFTSQIAGASVKAVRDLPDNTGISLVIPYHGKDRLITMTFEDIHTSGNTEADNEDLYSGWLKQLKSSTSIIPEPAPMVRSTAKPVAKKATSKTVRGKTQ